MLSTKRRRNACSSVFVTHTSFPLVGVAQQTVWQGATSSTSRKRNDLITTKNKENKETESNHDNNPPLIENTEQQPVREVGVELKNEMHAAASVQTVCTLQRRNTCEVRDYQYLS